MGGMREKTSIQGTWLTTARMTARATPWETTMTWLPGWQWPISSTACKTRVATSRNCLATRRAKIECIALADLRNLRELASDIGEQHAFPLALVDLAQARLQPDGFVHNMRKVGSRLASTSKIAAVKGIDVTVAQLGSQAAGFGLADRVQGRVGLTLETPFHVPIRLSMANQPEGDRHERLLLPDAAVIGNFDHGRAVALGNLLDIQVIGTG